jgi:4-aminobutyrate aminotransferase / (S)-3-amino-2-methylpropionate transaminase / 5-aminovalerate transaminase
LAKTARILTPVPGPRSRELLARREVIVPRGVGQMAPIFAASAQGAAITDVDGNVFIDFGGGIGVVNVGHTHPEVIEAVHGQVDKFLHTCFHVAMYEGYVRLAEELARLVPGAFPKKTLLINSGAEAVENAVKIARRHTGRPAVVTFENAFHGRTLLALSLTAKVSTYKYGFGPFAPEVYRAPFPYTYQSPFPTEDQASEWAFAGFRRLVEQELSPDKVAAVILEPVQGESGFLVTPISFMTRVVDYCRSHGILFIADEIQTGFGRTGTWTAMEHYGTSADLYTLAKSLGAGLPIAAVVGRAEVMDAPQVGGLGGTYGGNPVACAAALKTIEVMERDGYNAKAVAIGATVLNRFREFQRRFSLVGDVRGLGAMCAMELVVDRRTREPASDKTEAIFRRCYEKGLLLVKAGHYNQVIRFLAPLNISAAQLEEGLDILEEALAAESGREEQSAGATFGT